MVRWFHLPGIRRSGLFRALIKEGGSGLVSGGLSVVVGALSIFLVDPV